MALIAAAAFLAAGTAASPALAAPASRGIAKPASNCIPTKNSCYSLSSINDDTQLYIGTKPNGALQGFTSFSDFAQWAQNTYDVTFTRSDGAIHFASSGDSSDDNDNCDTKTRPGHHNDDDCDNNRPGNHNGDDCDDDDDDCDDSGGWSRMGRMAQSATFYDKASLTGPSFAVGKNDVIGKLSQMPKFGGGNWNNQISSVRVNGGPAGSPGVLLCSKFNCMGGWTYVLNNGDQTQLTLGLNNAVSSVEVF